jgi:hypothetical protein
MNGRSADATSWRSCASPSRRVSYNNHFAFTSNFVALAARPAQSQATMHVHMSR